MTAVGSPEGFRGTSRHGLRAAAVRRCLLAVSVLHDLDLTWDDGLRVDDLRDPAGGLPDVRVDGPVQIRMSGTRLACLLGDDVPDEPAPIARVARYLRLRGLVTQLSPDAVAASVRAVGLPVGHVLHPGPDWARVTVAGGALSLGLGLLPDAPALADTAFAGSALATPGLAEHAEDAPVPAFAAPTPLPLPAGVLEDEGFEPQDLWPAAMARLEELGTLAAARHRRRPRDPLRPLAEADVVTLLGSHALRSELAADAGTGLAALVVPMRNRGWVSSSAIDPAFGPAAAAAMSDVARGFERPLLVTAEEVVQVPEGGHPLRYLGDQPPGSPLS